MSKYTFTGPNGQSFEVKGPPGLTLEQARAAFDQQVKAGSLVGLSTGTVLSSATQAAAGLASAQASVIQTSCNKIGALGPGIPGATGAIGSPSRQTIVPSVAETTVDKIDQILATTAVSAPVNLVNVARQPEALTSISNLDQSQVTGVLAQTKNLVDQSSSTLSSNKGAGAYGFDTVQLERAGILKPGTAALVQAGADPVDVLKSPAVFTGKDGIKSTVDLLANPALQNQLQQQLMSRGVYDLATVGIPITRLSDQQLAGVAVNAAKSVDGTEAVLKNLSVPSSVSAEFSQNFNKNIRDNAFAANFTKNKVPDTFKDQKVPVQKIKSILRATLDAAIARIIGNDKVPEPKYTS